MLPGGRGFGTCSDLETDHRENAAVLSTLLDSIPSPTDEWTVKERALGLYPLTSRRVPHISVVFREM
jgi:hypothetical protein